jgi:hypothetical protein
MGMGIQAPKSLLLEHEIDGPLSADVSYGKMPVLIISNVRRSEERNLDHW